MRKFLAGLQHFLEWLIIFVYVVGGVGLFFSDPVTVLQGGPVVRFLGGQAALLLYGILFTLQGILLAYAKIRRKKKLHKYSLFTLWLTGLFTIFLEIVLVGFSWSLIDNLVATLAAGYCWLRWKFITEYIDPKAFYESTMPYRDDLPPNAT